MAVDEGKQMRGREDEDDDDDDDDDDGVVREEAAGGGDKIEGQSDVVKMIAASSGAAAIGSGDEDGEDAGNDGDDEEEDDDDDVILVPGRRIKLGEKVEKKDEECHKIEELEPDVIMQEETIVCKRKKLFRREKTERYEGNGEMDEQNFKDTIQNSHSEPESNAQESDEDNTANETDNRYNADGGLISDEEDLVEMYDLEENEQDETYNVGEFDNKEGQKAVRKSKGERLAFGSETQRLKRIGATGLQLSEKVIEKKPMKGFLDKVLKRKQQIERDAAIIQAEQEEEEAVEIMRTEHNEKENREPIQVDDVEQVIRRSALEHLNLNIHIEGNENHELRLDNNPRLRELLEKSSLRKVPSPSKQIGNISKEQIKYSRASKKAQVYKDEGVAAAATSQSEYESEGGDIFSEDGSDLSEKSEGSDSEDTKENEEEERDDQLPDEQLKAILQEKEQPNQLDFFDDEAEMSEDGGHEDDYNGDDEDVDIVRGLIGVGAPETERQGRRRAQLHARWNEDLDKQEEEEALNALENGYGNKRGRDDDENIGMDEMRRRANRRANVYGPSTELNENALQDTLPRLTYGINAMNDEIDDDNMVASFNEDIQKERLLQELIMKDKFKDANADESSKYILRLVSKTSGARTSDKSKHLASGIGHDKRINANESSTQSVHTFQSFDRQKFSFLGRQNSNNLQRTTSGIPGKSFVFTSKIQEPSKIENDGNVNGRKQSNGGHDKTGRNMLRTKSSPLPTTNNLHVSNLKSMLQNKTHSKLRSTESLNLAAILGKT